jgi:hypothetical protein
LLYDNLDFMNGVQAYLGAIPLASLVALRRGFQSVGVEDNAFTLFPTLMDSASLFLTANCDTVYFWGFIDLSEGPMVIDVPPSGRRRGFSAPSMTCGSAGSPTSASRARTAPPAAGI